VEDRNEDSVISNPKIGVIDLESTATEDSPICFAIGFYAFNDSKPTTFYIDKDLNSYQLIHKCIDEMMRSKYQGYTFYCHNLGKFDAVYILKALAEFNQTPEGRENPYIFKPLTRDADILKLVIKRNIDIKKSGDTNLKKTKTKIKTDTKTITKIETKPKTELRTVVIMDSYAVLTSSLKDLCKGFNVDSTQSKGDFPHGFSKIENLFYVGKTPDIFYYPTISKDDYKKLKLEC
jgi:hypothetical protein